LFLLPSRLALNPADAFLAQRMYPAKPPLPHILGRAGVGKRSFEVVGLTWIVERTFAWIGWYRRMSKDYGRRVQTSETLIDLIAIRVMLNRLTKS